MDFATIEAALEAWVGTEAPDCQVAWAHRSDADFLEPPVVELQLLSITQPAPDSVEYEYDDEAPVGDPEAEPDPVIGEELIVTVSGLRQLVVQVTVRSAEQTSVLQAAIYLEQLRSGLRKPSVLDALGVAGIGVIRAEQILIADAPSYDEDRWESVGSFDVVLSAAENLTDSSGTYIESVILSSDIDRPDGTALPAPPQFVDEEIP